MCTVSWLRIPGGYELFCNRDERHARKLAAPPAVRETRGVRFVAPADGDAGGTWIGVNEAGLTLCLLNRYEDAPSLRSDAAPRDDYRSRGLLLAGLMDCASVSQVRARVAGADLSRHRPFTLAAISADEPALLVRWKNNERSFDADGDASMPLTSSTYRTGGVIAARKLLFRRMVEESGAVSPAMLRDFHGSHHPERGPFSVCMHREDAATVSFSRVRVGGGTVEFSYQPGPPCAGSPAARVCLPLKREVAQAR
ncbi:MAG TPA: NRDE family protein [Pyrinomonadaceae bacterium]|nr:NRDE family protein [Pyrinomonadaceae bacterium]